MKTLCKRLLTASHMFVCGDWVAVHIPLVLVESFLQQMAPLLKSWQAELLIDPHQLQMNIQIISNDKLHTTDFYTQYYRQMITQNEY